MWYFPFHYDPSYVFLNLIFTTKNHFVFLQIRKSKLSVTRVTQTISEELGIQHVSSDFIIYYHFWRGPCHTACEILVPWPGIKPMTQHWKHGVLSTGPPEASHVIRNLKVLIKILWKRQWQPTPVLLPGDSHVRRSLVGYSPWDFPGNSPGVGCHFLRLMYQVHNK